MKQTRSSIILHGLFSIFILSDFSFSAYVPRPMIQLNSADFISKPGNSAGFNPRSGALDESSEDYTPNSAIQERNANKLHVAAAPGSVPSAVEILTRRDSRFIRPYEPESGLEMQNHGRAPLTLNDLRFMLLEKLRQSRRELYRKPQLRSPKKNCFLNAGLGYGCDYQDLVNAMDEHSYWNNAGYTPGK